MSTKKKTKTKADLQREVIALTAQLAGMYHFADDQLSRCGHDRMQGSAAILSITASNGKELVMPIAILNGLSKESIAALRADIVRSYEYAIEFKPKGAK